MKREYLWIAMLFLFVAILVSPSYAKINPETIVAMWLFDEGIGDEIMDSSGNENTGVCPSGHLKWVDGRFGKAVEFTGSNPISVEHRESFSMLTFTLMVWVNFQDVEAGWQTVFQKQGDGREHESRNYALQGAPVFSKNGVARGLFEGALAQVIGSTTVVDASWHHIALSCDIENFKIYVDGQLDGTEPLSSPPPTSEGPLAIGGEVWDLEHGESIKALVDEMVFFNVVLDEEDIKAIADKGLNMTIFAVSSEDKLAITWGQVKSSD